MKVRFRAGTFHTRPTGTNPELARGFLVRQAGPRRLWDRVEEAVAFWQHAGQHNYDRFGLTATTTEQYVWYDHPDSQHRWPLPTAHPVP